jgi:hypothetical protein
MLLRRAFLVDPAQQLGGAWFQAVWAKLGSKRLRWERRRALLYDYALASMRQLGEALLDGFQQSRPRVPLDSSSSRSIAVVTSCHHTRGAPSVGTSAPP